MAYVEFDADEVMQMIHDHLLERHAQGKQVRNLSGRING